MIGLSPARCPVCGFSGGDPATPCPSCGIANRQRLAAEIASPVIPASVADGATLAPFEHAPTSAPFESLATKAPFETAPTARPVASGRIPDSAPGEPVAGPLRVGQQFGRYTIIRLLGAGGMGAVYQAWDEELEVPVALKVIRRDVTEDPAESAELERRFKRELLLARQVTHPNVVRIYDLGERDGIKYITMAYEQGTDLAQTLHNGALPVRDVLHIVRGLVSGLAAAHDAGVVHRDLKPANVLIKARTGEPLIMDFGIARSAAVVSSPADPAVAAVAGVSAVALSSVVTTRTLGGAVMGTIAYMAPEQARAQVVDHRADLYALGLIAYDLLLGNDRRAQGLSAIEELRRRIEHPPAPLRRIDPSVPEAVERIVMRCLEPDLAKRYGSAREIQADLAQLDADGEPLPVIRRLTGRMIAATVLAMVALFGAMYWAIRPAPPPRAPDPVSILVADFDDRTNDPVFKGTLENVLGTSMEGASFITSYGRQAARALAERLRPGKALDAESARLVAAREGIKVVLAGTIEANGPAYRVSVRAVDPATAKQIAATTKTARSKQDVLGAIASVAATLRGQLGDTAPESARRAAMETVTAGSLEALDAYERGQELARSNQLAEALVAYRRATQLDPGFGRAYAGMAVVYNDLKDEPRKNAAYQEALKHLDRMTEREKYRTLGTYYLLTAHNYEKAVENYELLLKLYPADTAGHGNLGMAYMLMGHPDLAANEARAALRIYPNNLKQRYNLALYLMYAGDFDGAIQGGSKIIGERPTYAVGYLPVALSMTARGDVDAAEKTYDQLASQGEVGASLAALGRTDLAMYRGRFKQAAKLAAAALTGKDAANDAIRAQHVVDEAQSLLALGDDVRAAAAARKAVTIGTHESILFPAARVLVETGHPEEARAIAERLENMLQLHTTAYARLIAAEIAVREGRFAAAVELFRDSIKRRDTWFARFLLGQTYAKTEHFAEAMAELDLAVKRRGEITDAFLYDRPTLRYLPPAYYWLARAQQAMGVADARKTYEKFLELRASSDVTDPLASDARRRLGTQF